MHRSKLKTRNGPVEYTITHRRRVTRRLHMELDETGGLVVVAPQHWSRRHIDSTLRLNATRVEQFLARARQRQLKPLEYVSGEVHLYLGIRYPLMIRNAGRYRSSVNFTGSEIRVGVSREGKTGPEVVLRGWYRTRAQEVFAERLQVIKQRAPWARDKSVPLKLRRMRRTWGNCSSSGVIKLNTHLVKAAPSVIDSVIAHELCHLQEMNHSGKFYALLEGLNPDWRADRSHLRSHGNQYLLS